MKSEKIRLYTLEISLILFFLFAMIYNNIITRQVLAVILLVFMVISKILIKTDKLELTNNKQIILLLSGIGITYVVLMYLLGIFTGFYRSTVQFSKWSIINYIIPYIVIIVSSENIRKTILQKESKYSKIIMLVAMVILDTILNTNIYNLKTTNDYFVLVTFIIFASIANNMLFNHIIIKYRNMPAIIIYRLITTLYIYLIPITPDIYIFIESILKMIVPYIIYVILENLFSTKVKIISVGQKKKDRIITAIVYAIIIIIVMLISCKFRYGLIVIGSGSMTGTINKGDIIFFERYKSDEKIETGDIVIFNKKDTKIVHRIIDQRLMGTETRYYTKGDANQDQDDGYIEKDDIVGQVKARIPYVGYLTLWVNNLIGGNK